MSREEKRDETAVSRRPFLVLTVKFIRRERSSADRFAKIHFWRRFLLENRREARAPFSGVFENQDAAVGDEGLLAAGFVGIEAVVADGLFSLGREMVDDGGDEIRGFADLEVTLGGVVALGALDDGLGGGVPGDFLEGGWMTEEIFCEAFAAFGVVGGGDGFFAAVVDVEAGVFPGEEVGETAGADAFAVAQGLEDAVSEEFDGGGEVLGGHAVEATVGGDGSDLGKIRVGEFSRDDIGLGATVLLGARRALDGLEQNAPATVFPVIAIVGSGTDKNAATSDAFVSR